MNILITCDSLDVSNNSMQVCAPDGAIFDIINIVPYVQKHHKHPVTGEPLALKDLIKLRFHKNADGEYACPVLHKVFTEHTHIVGIRTTGHVYCFEVCSSCGPTHDAFRQLFVDLFVMLACAQAAFFPWLQWAQTLHSPATSPSSNSLVAGASPFYFEKRNFKILLM